MKVKLDPTITAVVIWLVVFLMASDAEEVSADPYLEFGQMQSESDATFAGVGYTYKDKWDANVTFIGEGQTDFGKHPRMKIMSVSRLIYPVWTDHKFFMGIGLSKTEMRGDDVLVGEWNYKLQFGWDFGRSKLFYQHHSSGDVNTTNTGLDMITLQVKL